MRRQIQLRALELHTTELQQHCDMTVHRLLLLLLLLKHGLSSPCLVAFSKKLDLLFFAFSWIGIAFFREACRIQFHTLRTEAFPLQRQRTAPKRKDTSTEPIFTSAHRCNGDDTASNSVDADADDGIAHNGRDETHYKRSSSS